ncbi:MAG: efflux RND transporter periplasmic adaptor subunit [Nitrospiraceae bacterium]|nr:MAG: efflux RND transporter periplasmic adaptor subunit [Nitrospiraceae bacterium]
MKMKKTLSVALNIISSSYAVISFFLIAAIFLHACSKGESKPASKNTTFPVTVSAVINKDVPVQVRAIGNVEAYSTVAITARVAGELVNVNFREGQDVNKGDLLFTIDPRPYETALAAAKALLAKDMVLAKKAEDDLKRYTGLFREQLVSRDDYELVQTNAEALKATIEADRAAVENAGLQLGYCSVHAPVSGRTGSLLVNRGNLIRANDDSPMVVINQVQPVYVNFSVPEQNLPEIKQYVASGRPVIEAFISGSDSAIAEGALTFVDNAVDTSTGMIKLKATFTNKDKKLWPGQFVNIVMTLTTQHDAIVTPSQAVLSGQQGQYVFVVKDDMSVESRPVGTDRTLNGETVITHGLQPGEKVVTDGQIRLAPGVKVEIKEKRGKDQ